MIRSAIDILARPIGLTAALLVIASIAATAGLGFDRLASRVAQAQAEVESHRGTRVDTTYGDLTRLRLAVLSAKSLGEVSDEFRREIGTASDILYVRSDHITRRLAAQTQVGETLGERQLRRAGEAAAASLRAIVNRTDTALASQSIDAETFADETDALIGEANSRLSAYLLELNRTEQRLIEKQSQTLVSLTRSFWVFISLMSAASVVSILLLRREVKHRTEREIMEARARFLALFDPMTELPNRIQFTDAVTSGLAQGGAQAILIVDIDGFRELNDRLGQAMGDVILKVTADRLSEEVEDLGAMVARIGGDEFAVWFAGPEVASLAAVGKRIGVALSKSITVGGEVVSPEVSIGAADTPAVSRSLRPTFETMMRVADFALETARADGGACVRLYDADLERRFLERRLMSRELPDAVRCGELEVFLQPQVRLEEGSIYGFEALVRWRRNGVIVPPGEFISLAEEAHLIVEIDRFVMSEAVAIVSAWNRRHGTDYTIGVNLSAIHLLTPDLTLFVASLVEREGFDPARLTLEVTETVEIREWDRVRAVLRDLAQIGVRISIDDFGAGYSSLAYLRTIQAHELKIDRSLVSEIDCSDEARFIVDAVLDLSRTLGLEIVVEGIEREAQVALLHDLGCTRGQGFLFGKPGPADEWLADATFREAAPRNDAGAA